MGGNNARQIFVGDFETTTDPNDCRVWLWGLCSVDDVDEIVYGTDIESFCEYLSRESATVYFHNLAFDGSFILDHILREGFAHVEKGRLKPKSFNSLISSMGKFYSIHVKWESGAFTEFRDSLKKLPMSVSNVAKTFQLEESKGTIDYDKPREIGYEPDENELEYLENDLKIIARALIEQFSQGMKRLTVGADSLAEFKELFGGKRFSRIFPVLPLPMDTEIRMAYRGGFTYADPRFSKKITGPGRTYDVNSLYPHIMYSKPMPYGVPKYFRTTPVDKSYPLWVMSITFTARLKENHIPCIQIKGHNIFGGTEYLTEIDEPVTLVCTNVDYDLWKDHYDLEVYSFNGGWQFKSVEGVFDEYINKWSKIKSESEGGLRAIAKLHLNSLYGKFATNPDVTPKIPTMENGVVKLVRGTEELREPVYTAVGVFVTSYARDLTIRAAQEHYDVFAYADTDSLHLLVDKDPESLDIDPNRMGAWKHESTWQSGMFIRAKCYIEQMENGHFETHVAGLPMEIAEQLTFQDFIDKNEFEGKLVPHRVPGGVVLANTSFTLNL